MMVDSRISSKKFMKKTIKNNLRMLDSGTSIDLLMIWLLTQSNLMVDLCGPAKTTMVMFNQILLRKVMDLSVL
jgi:hypothetical protein